MLHEFTSTVLLIVAGLFPVINPPASGFIVLSLSPDATPAERADLARRIAIYGFAILLVSLSIGAYVLSFFGISIPVLRAAGGLVIAAAGWKLLNASSDDKKDHAPAPGGADSLSVRAFYPLTLPITVGPGSIAVAIALATQSPPEGLSPVHFAAVGTALVILSVSIYVCVRFAANVEKLLGAVGSQIAMRLFAFIVFCIGVQILWLGLADLLASVKAK